MELYAFGAKLQINKTGNGRIYITLKCVRVTIVAVAEHKYYKFCLCVSIVPFVIRHANRTFFVPHYIVTCVLSGSTIFFHIHKWNNFLKKVINEHKVFDFLYNFYPKHFSFYAES
jgi:hypothetical protein